MRRIIQPLEGKWRRPRATTLFAQITVAFLCGTASLEAVTGKLDQALSAYDAAITADITPAVAKLATPVTLNGTAGAPFDFGATSGDATMEFILQGDPTAGPDAYLAVGETPASSLRYAQWQDTREMGFTQGGVADYFFTPAVPSPTAPTHVAYAWNAAEQTMTVYVNGVLAGTTTGVSSDFALPSGAGTLGATAGGAEVMTGTIYRVTVYSGVLPETQIKTHADAFANVALPRINSFVATPGDIQPLASSSLSWSVQNASTVYLNGSVVTATNQTVSPPVTTTYTLIASNEVATTRAKVRLLVDPRLDLYDTTIATDQTNGLIPLALLTNTVTLSGSGGEPFDFGATSGSATLEFIVEGDPTAGPDAFLAVGENTTSSLRYAQWSNTDQMGFTQGGVADYLFAPGVPSPTIATHVAYVWNAETLTMKIYVNGVLAGTLAGVSSDFAMPAGSGFLGSSASGTEALTGRIFRVVIYAGDLPEATLQKHATAFTSVLRPPIISSFNATSTDILGQGTSTLNWQVQDAIAVYLNGTNVTSLTKQLVAPKFSTTYTLLASNNISTVSAKVRVTVTPVLTNYDAVIVADTTNGFAPLALLTNTVTLTGAGGVPFDFGPTAGDTTIEFILEGDPTAGPDGYLAVGENTASNLRYAQWQNTQQMGFTQVGVADYLFTPAVASPTIPTHLAFVWNSSEQTMNVYTNGALAGSTTGVSSAFAMPTGAGFLGSTATGGEALTGRIFRVAVYSGIVPEAIIQKHSASFLGPVPPAAGGPSLSIAISSFKPSITLHGVAGTHYRVEYRDALSGAGTWQLLEDVPSLSGASVSLTDSTAISGRVQRFYRAVTAQ